MALISDAVDRRTHRPAPAVPLPAQRPPDAGGSGPIGLPAGAVTGDADLRDRLTRAHLRPAGQLPAADRRFRRRWWDGGAWVASLVVETPRGRVRLIECGGRTIAVPAARWRARRAVRRVRRPAVTDAALLRLMAKASTGDRPEPHTRVTVVTLPDHRTSRPGSPHPPGGDGRGALAARPSRARPVVSIQAQGDARRCAHPGCAALVPVPPPGRLAPGPARCPACGRS